VNDRDANAAVKKARKWSTAREDRSVLLDASAKGLD
jgi:hypothetical protein